MLNYWIEVNSMNEKERYQIFLQDQLTIPARLLRDYHKLHLTEQELIVLLHIHRFQSIGKMFPTPAEIAELVSFDEQTCSQLLRQLMQKHCLSIIENKNSDAKVDERYSLEPLWEQLFIEKVQSDSTQNEHIMNIFILFEQEFGRALSPIEIETINIWLDQDNYDPSLIKAALREAVLMSKLNFKYIDRILREWERKGIQTVEQARKQAKSFHTHQQSNDQQTIKRDSSVYYNWLEEDE